MEQVTILTIVGVVLALPYLAYGWFYGLTLLKKLLEKEWRKQKGLLKAYENLTPEQRMQGELNRINKEETLERKAEWLSPATPKEAEQFNQEVIVKGGLRHQQAPEGVWQEEKPEEPPPISRLP